MSGRIITYSPHSNPNDELSRAVARYVMMASFTTAMGGLMFGYQFGVFGGITQMAPFLAQFFPSIYELDQSTNRNCKLDNLPLANFACSLYMPAMLASLVAAFTTRLFGCHFFMLLCGLLSGAGAICSALAWNLTMLYIGRSLSGAGVGIAIQLVPLYVSEMAPHKYRRWLNVSFQLSIAIGIFLANLVNCFTNQIGSNMGWRISLGFAAIPAFIIIVAQHFFVEFQYFGARQGVFKGWKNLLTHKYRAQLILAYFFPLARQRTGINSLILSAPEVFKNIGFGNNASLLLALVIGGVNVLASIIPVYRMDNWGRRCLLFVGTCFMFFQVLALCLAKFAEDYLSFGGYQFVAVVCICGFVGAFACSWGRLGWLVPSEVLTPEIQSSGQTILVFSSMFCNFESPNSVPFLTRCHTDGFTFLQFTTNYLLVAIFFIFVVPETVNVSAEGVVKVLRRHKMWKQFVDAYSFEVTSPTPLPALPDDLPEIPDELV